jgi:hypothetical protein
MYIMAPEPISEAYFINASHQSVCMRIVAMHLLGKNVTAAMNTRKTRSVGRVFFYAVGVVSKESRRLVLPSAFCFL